MNKLFLKLKQEYLWLRILLGIFIFSSFLLVTSKAVDPDLYWHITLGEQTLNTRHVFSADNFTFTMPGYPWPDHEWLGEIGISWLYRHDLWAVGIAISAIFTFIPFVFWLKRYKKLPEIVVAALAGVLVLTSIAARPQSFSFILFFVLLEILHYVFISPRKRKLLLLLLVPMFLLWANLHGGFITGLGAFGVFLFGAGLSDFFKKKRFSTELKLGLLVFAACVLATFINPYGLRLYNEMLAISFGKNLAKYVSEWGSPFQTDGLLTAFFLGTYFVLVARYFKKYPLPELLVSIALGLFFIKARKAGYFFMVSSVPIMALGISFLREEVKKSGTVFSPKEKRVGALFLIIFFAATLFYLAAYTRAIFFYYPVQMPEKATEFILKQIQNGEKVKIFNDYNWGGYLTYKIPRFKVFFDGRMPSWRDEKGFSAMEEYAKVVYEKPSKWQEIFARWQINEVLIMNAGDVKYGKGVYVLEKMHLVEIPFDFEKALKDAGWRILYEDDIAVVLRKPQ